MGLLDRGRKLDDRFVPPAKPGSWSTDGLMRIGTIVLIVFGGGGLVRLIFRDGIRTPAVGLALYFGIGLIGLALLLTGAARKRR